MRRGLEAQLFCDRKVCYGIRIERLVGDASLNGVIDYEFYFVPLDYTAGVQRRHKPAVKLIGSGSLELEKFADPACYIIFIARLRNRPCSPQHSPKDLLNFGWIAANFPHSGADPTPGQPI